MRIVTAIDSFKGSASAQKAAESIERGIKSVFTDAVVCNYPLADGGEGLVEAILTICPGSKCEAMVKDPLGRDITAFYGLLDNGTAVIEMAAASGLPLLTKEERNPWHTSTYGTGQLILAALDAGANEIMLGLGGSATNDGGMGMARALGIRFLDENGAELEGVGGDLEKVKTVDVTGKDRRLEAVSIRMACDVTNPLCGREGASHIFGGQKGADEAMRYQLDTGMKQYAEAIKEACGVDYADVAGAGAAGGLGVPLLAFFGASTASGIELVLDTLQMDEDLQRADLVITGEGRLDGQTLFGKAPIGVAKRAKQYGKPVIALTGSIGDGYRDVYQGGIDAVFSIQNGPCSLEESMNNTEYLLEDCAHRVMQFYKNVKKASL